MAAEKEPFLVPAPPPPLKDESGGGGGPEVQSHQEAASGELRDGTEHGPGPRAHSAGAAASGGGGPQAQAHGEPHGRAAAPADVGEERRGGGGTDLGPPAPPRPRNGYQPHHPQGVVGAKEEIAVTWGEGAVEASNIRPSRGAGE